MAKYAKIDASDIVEQVQPNDETSFVLVDKSVIPGMLHDGGAAYDAANFSTPAPVLPTPTINDIKSEANRRIELAMPSWMVSREVSGGTPITQTIKDYAAAIRTDSATLEASLPSDYQDDIHWTTAP